MDIHISQSLLRTKGPFIIFSGGTLMKLFKMTGAAILVLFLGGCAGNFFTFPVYCETTTIDQGSVCKHYDGCTCPSWSKDIKEVGKDAHLVRMESENS